MRYQIAYQLVRELEDKLDLSEEWIKELTDQTTYNVMKDDKRLNFETKPAAVYDFNIPKYLRKWDVGNWIKWFNRRRE